MRKTRFIVLSMLAITSLTVHAQGLILGMLLGLAIGSSGPSESSNPLKQNGLSAIPLRCLSVGSDEDYKDCRWTSIMAELQVPRNNIYADRQTPYCAALLGPTDEWEDSSFYTDAKKHPRACDVEWHIKIELDALKAINESLKTPVKPKD